MVALYNTKETFLSDKMIQGLTLRYSNGKCTGTFADVPFGKYAVSIFFDENQNGELDTNWLGIPKEPFGFSNNPPMRFGPPSYEDAIFSIEQHEMTISVSF